MYPPVEIEVNKKTRQLCLTFADGVVGVIAFDDLRNASPAANGKPDAPVVGVNVETVELVGNYALRPIFSDGHQSGLYDWDLLRYLARGQGDA